MRFGDPSLELRLAPDKLAWYYVRLRAQYDPVGDEGSVAVVADESDALSRGGCCTGGINHRSILEVDSLLHSITSLNREAIWRKVGDSAEHDVPVVVLMRIPPLLPRRVGWICLGRGRNGDPRRPNQGG